jgi:hypothetical protein
MSVFVAEFGAVAVPAPSEKSWMMSSISECRLLSSLPRTGRVCRTDLTVVWSPRAAFFVRHSRPAPSVPRRPCTSRIEPGRAISCATRAYEPNGSRGTELPPFYLFCDFADRFRPPREAPDKRPRSPPPSLVRSTAWLAYRRRDPKPINIMNPSRRYWHAGARHIQGSAGNRGEKMPFRLCWLFWEALSSSSRGLPATLAQAGPPPSRSLAL